MNESGRTYDVNIHVGLYILQSQTN